MVFNELYEAKKLYKEMGDKSRVRSLLRHGSGISRNIQPLTEGIPQDDGLGLLKGALKIIFSVRKFQLD